VGEVQGRPRATVVRDAQSASHTSHTGRRCRCCLELLGSEGKVQVGPVDAREVADIDTPSRRIRSAQLLASATADASCSSSWRLGVFRTSLGPPLSTTCSRSRTE
jgi:hypothetical protein